MPKFTSETAREANLKAQQARRSKKFRAAMERVPDDLSIKSDFKYHEFDVFVSEKIPEVEPSAAPPSEWTLKIRELKKWNMSIFIAIWMGIILGLILRHFK